MTLEATIASIKDDISYLTDASSKSDQISAAYGRLSPLVRVSSVNSSLYAVARSFFIRNGASAESASILALISASIGKILKKNVIVVASELVRQGLTNVNGLQSTLSMLAGQGYTSFTQDTSESILTKAPSRYIPPGSYTHPPVIITETLPDGTEFAAYSAFIEATDQDFGDIMVFTIPNLPAWLTMTEIRNGLIELTGTPGSGTAGVYPLLVTCTNPNGQYDQETLDLEIINVNEAPYFTSSPTINTSEGAAYVYNITTADPDVGDTREITATTKPSWLDIVDNLDGTAVLSGTVPYDSVENLTVTLRVEDAGGLFALQTYVIVVSNTNRPPEFLTYPDILELVYDNAYEYQFEVFDPDGDDMVVEDLVLPAWLTFEMFDATTGRIYGTPTESDIGVHPVSLQVTDEYDASATQSFEIEVTAALSLDVYMLAANEYQNGPTYFQYQKFNYDTYEIEDIAITDGVYGTRYTERALQATPSTIVGLVGYNSLDENGSDDYLASWVFYSSLHCWFDFNSNVIEKFENKTSDWFVVSSGSIAYVNDGQRYSTCLSETNTKCLMSPAFGSNTASTFSISAWIKLTDVSTYRMLFGLGAAANLGTVTDPGIWVEFDPAKGFVAHTASRTIEQNNTSLDPNKWYFVVVIHLASGSLDFSVKGDGVDFHSRLSMSTIGFSHTSLFVGDFLNDAGVGARISHLAAYTSDDMYTNDEIDYLYNNGAPYTMDDLGILGRPNSGLYAYRYDGTGALVEDAYYNLMLNVPNVNNDGLPFNKGDNLLQNYYHIHSAMAKIAENRFAVITNYLINHNDPNDTFDWPMVLTVIDYDPVAKLFTKSCEREIHPDGFPEPAYILMHNGYLIIMNNIDLTTIMRLEAYSVVGNEIHFLNSILPPSGVTFDYEFGFSAGYKWKLYSDGTYIYLTNNEISTQPVIYTFDGISFTQVFHQAATNLGKNLGMFTENDETYIISTDYTGPAPSDIYVHQVNFDDETLDLVASYTNPGTQTDPFIRAHLYSPESSILIVPGKYTSDTRGVYTIWSGGIIREADLLYPAIPSDDRWIIERTDPLVAEVVAINAPRQVIQVLVMQGGQSPSGGFALVDYNTGSNTFEITHSYTTSSYYDSRPWTMNGDVIVNFRWQNPTPLALGAYRPNLSGGFDQIATMSQGARLYKGATKISETRIVAFYTTSGVPSVDLIGYNGTSFTVLDTLALESGYTSVGYLCSCQHNDKAVFGSGRRFTVVTNTADTLSVVHTDTGTSNVTFSTLTSNGEFLSTGNGKMYYVNEDDRVIPIELATDTSTYSTWDGERFFFAGNNTQTVYQTDTGRLEQGEFEKTDLAELYWATPGGSSNGYIFIPSDNFTSTTTGGVLRWNGTEYERVSDFLIDSWPTLGDSSNMVAVVVGTTNLPDPPEGNTVVSTLVSLGVPTNEMVAAITQADNTSSGAAIVGRLATASITQANNTGSSTLQDLGVALSATLTATQVSDTMVATSTRGRQATLTATQSSNTMVATSTRGRQATLTATQAGNTVTATSAQLGVGWNSIEKHDAFTLSGLNLIATSSNSSNTNWESCKATHSATTKMYYEGYLDAGNITIFFGLSPSTHTVTGTTNTFAGKVANSIGYLGADGSIYVNSVIINTGPTYAVNDIIGIAYDPTSGSVWFSKNNVWILSGDPANNVNPVYTGLTGSQFPILSSFVTTTGSFHGRFKAADFSYSPPTGFVAWE